MGRFDALTQLDTKPLKTPSQPDIPIAGLPANPQTRKDASMQTPKPVNVQTGLPANRQTGKPVFLEKYSTYLTPECKRGLKRIAFETDRKDYEVLVEAVEHYLERQKQPKE